MFHAPPSGRTRYFQMNTIAPPATMPASAPAWLERRQNSASSLKQHIKIETVISEVSVDTLLDKIQQVLKVGDVGEGKVFVSEICAVMRVRTGERDYDALQ